MLRLWPVVFLLACSRCASTPSGKMDPECQEVTDGFGPKGTTQVHAVVVASGLEVPWGIGFLPGNRLLVTERPGRVRLIENGALLPAPLATLSPMTVGESGLLGVAVDP